MIALILVIILAILIVMVYILSRRWTVTQLTGASEVPRRIWIYWSQGWDQAPPLCHLCLESWRTHHRNWEVNALSRQSLVEYLTPDVLERIDALPTYQSKSDYIRFAILRYYGGIWVDSTLFCIKPLEIWLPALHGGLFMFSFPCPRLINKMTLTSSWFIAAAAPSNYMMTQLYDAVVNYWEHPPAQHYYFWAHKLFDKLYDTNPIFRRMWKRISPINNLHTFLVGSGPLVIGMADIKGGQTPVYKLNHRYRLHPKIEASLIATLREADSPSQRSIE